MQNFAIFEWLLWQQGKWENLKWERGNLNNTVRLPDPENKGVGKHRAQLSFTGTSYTALKSP